MEHASFDQLNLNLEVFFTSTRTRVLHCENRDAYTPETFGAFDLLHTRLCTHH